MGVSKLVVEREKQLTAHMGSHAKKHALDVLSDSTEHISDIGHLK
jgi:hypothetical protein